MRSGVFPRLDRIACGRDFPAIGGNHHRTDGNLATPSRIPRQLQRPPHPMFIDGLLRFRHLRNDTSEQ